MQLEEKVFDQIKINRFEAFRKSILYNSTPTLPNRIDLIELSPSMDDNVLSNLLDYKFFQLELFADETRINVLNHLFYLQKKAIQLSSNHEIAIGYPFLFEVNEQQPLSPCAAPLFIFPVRIEHGRNRNDAWYLKAIENQTPIPNYPLIEHIRNGGYPEKIITKIDLFINNGVYNAITFSKLSNDLEVLLNDAQSSSNLLKVFPKSNDIVKGQERFTIGRHLILGHYDIHNFNKNKQVRIEKVATEIPELAYSYSPFINNPKQDLILRQAIHTPKSIINGLKGTGKTYTAANLALKALINKKTVLYINAKKEGRASFVQHISSLGLGQKVLELTTPFDFVHQTVSMLRGLISQGSKTIKINKAKFDEQYKEYQRMLSFADEQQKLLNQPLVGDWSWIQLIGLQLYYKRQAGQDDISGFLDSSPFSFTIEEFETLSETAKIGKAYYGQIEDKDNPLFQLHPNNFVPFEMSRAAKTALLEKVKYFQYQINKLRLACVQTEKTYNLSVQNQLLRQYKSLKDQTLKAKQKLQSAQNIHGNDLINGSTVFSTFSSKKKQIKGFRKEYIETIKQLYAAYVATDDFNGVPDFNQFDDFKQIPTILSSLEQSLEQWHSNIPKIVHNKSVALHQNTVFPNKNDGASHLNLYTKVAELIVELEESNVFIQVPLNTKNRTQELLNELESFTFKLNQIEKELNQSFIDFFPWRKLWFNADSKTQAVLDALIKSNAENWPATFSAWYFEQRMSAESPISPLEDNYHNKLGQYNSFLQTNFKAIVNNIWIDERTSALKKLKKSDKKQSEFIFKKKKAIDLSDQFDLSLFLIKEANTLNEIFPVFVCSPAFVLQHFTENQLKNDFLIIDDANNINEDDLTILGQLGNQQFIFNDNANLQYNTSQAVPNFELDYVQQGTLPEVVRAQKQLLKGDFMEAIPSYKWIEADGHFDKDIGSNILEAQSILQYLYNTEEKDYQARKVAIVCMTDLQQQLLEQKLLLIKTKRAIGSGRIQLLESHNQLNIYTIQQISLIDADEIIYSFTYDKNGYPFEAITEKKVQELVYSVLSTAKKQSIFVHSFPEQFTSAIEFSHYLYRYFMAVSTSSEALQIVKPQHKAGEFLYETYKYLKPYFEENRLKIEHEFNSVAPKSVIVRPIHENQAQQLIIFGQIATDTPLHASLWEGKILDSLKHQNVHTIYSNPYEWWINPAEEARSIAAKIIANDKLNAPRTESIE